MIKVITSIVLTVYLKQGVCYLRLPRLLFNSILEMSKYFFSKHCAFNIIPNFKSWQLYFIQFVSVTRENQSNVSNFNKVF